MTIEQAKKNIGASVKYDNYFTELEYGVITSVNDQFVFVRYGNKLTSQATRPDMLRLILKGGTE